MGAASILMLEHDDDDRFITKKFFDENHPGINVTFAVDSNELFHILAAAETHPSLLLLNQHAFPLSIIQILKQLKSDLRYHHIPVVVLSGTREPNLIRDCYAAGASSFIQKPDTIKETVIKISNFVNYWFQTVEFVQD